MAIGYAPKERLLEHADHEIEIALYGTGTEGIESVTIECVTCGCVLIEGQGEI